MEFTAPGRVNLIGEYTDYTGGYVLPMAIPFRTVVRLTAADAGWHFSSAQFPERREVPPGRQTTPLRDWTDYPVGVLEQLLKAGEPIRPARLAYSGNVPLGAGLSSSASIEVATAVALLACSGRRMPVEQVALLCQRAENEFAGSPCGIMDQFAITAAKAGHALLLNTRDLRYEHLPMNQGRLSECVIVIANSRIRHSVAAGEYGTIRREMEAGQAVLRERFGVRDLGDATLEQLTVSHSLMSGNSYPICRHVITENLRVLEAREAMLAGDPVSLGDAMTRSHHSQRDDLGTSVEEIDFLVEAALQLPGCYGARLTGAGFGGCTVNLVQDSLAEDFGKTLSAKYEEVFGIHPEIYVCAAADGAASALGKETTSGVRS